MFEKGLLFQFVGRTLYYSKSNVYNVTVFQANMNKENIYIVLSDNLV